MTFFVAESLVFIYLITYIYTGFAPSAGLISMGVLINWKLNTWIHENITKREMARTWKMYYFLIQQN